MGSGGPEPSTSYRVVMTSMIAVATASALDLTAGAGVIDERGESPERGLGAVEISVGLGVDPALGIADRGMRHAHAAVEPGAAAEAADHRDLHRLHDRGAGGRS